MARIQILELPSVVIGEVVETPFVLILDQLSTDEASDDLADGLLLLKSDSGAKSIVTFEGTVDIPANH